MLTKNFTSFSQFIKLLSEEIHPELRGLLDKPLSGFQGKSKRLELIRKIKDLTSRGEKTGVESNMPKGSARAYIPHSDPHEVVIDNQSVPMKIGTKVAIKSKLDPHRWDRNGPTLGEMQNDVELDVANDDYRVLHHHATIPGRFSTNTTHPILPPLIERDPKNSWATVGHVDTISRPQFRRLTVTPEFPKGISHQDFYNTLYRDHARNNGRYWERGEAEEKRLDELEHHPLVSSFLDYQGNTGHPPNDYYNIGNLGSWTHPVTGRKYIVARDHGFSSSVASHYSAARETMNKYK